MGEYLDSIYMEIGGCFAAFALLVVFLWLRFLCSLYFVARARQHFKKVNFYTLQRYNLEQQYVVSFLSFPFFYLYFYLSFFFSSL